MTPWLVGLLFVWPMLVSWLIGRRKGYRWFGAFPGLMFSWLGVLAVALWRPTHDELVRREQDRLAAEQEAREKS
jgi:hypothetical protein